MKPNLLIRTLFIANLCMNFVIADETPSKNYVFFETKIRPALSKYCYECHSKKSKELGGKLRLDSVAKMRQGGESGAAFVAGDSAKSLIIQALKYDGLAMPPDQPLPESVIRDFETWVAEGAEAPEEADVSLHEMQQLQQDHWAWQPVDPPKVPAVSYQTWPLNSIDQFVLSRIEAANLQPAKDASPEDLIRRLHYDLTGLPPSYDEIQSFSQQYAASARPAVEELVDRLLANPAFGERWGRHWLDVARYAESNGNDGLSRNPTFPHAWRYRDYVISAFNKDLPYDQFLKEQIAGDLLDSESPEQRDQRLVATGFLAMSAKPAKAMNNDFAMDVVADQLDVVGRGVMGLSVGCARCHDHKFDPIPTREYYALAGIFTSTNTMWGVAANEGLTAPPTDLHVLESAPHVLPPKDFVETVFVLESNTGKPKPIPKSRWKVGTPLAMGVRDQKKPADCKINIKGNSKKLGDTVPRGVLAFGKAVGRLKSEIPAGQSGRLQLAEWLTDEQHPLTSRVMVNRIWSHLFGQGIVRTPDDFGVYGERPTHPKLLDHLATEFVDGHWSVKQMIRAIVLSRTYQLTSRVDEWLLQEDATNKLLTYHRSRRLDAESLRDSMLFASGQLNLTPADGSIVQHRDILVNLAGNLHQPSSHRSVYLCYLRSSPPPELAAFDLPEFTSVTGLRNESTVPNHALHLYNNPFVIEQATMCASGILGQAATGEDRAERAWQRILGRNPTEAEVAQALALVNDVAPDLKSEEKAWACLCQGLLVTNEFRYVD